VLRQAWKLDDAAKAEKLIRNLAQRLERDAPGVSKSILEGLDEILAVSRLGLPAELRRSTTASPRDHLDAAQRVAATVMDCSVSEVARRHDISPRLLFLWRRQAAEATKNAESKVRGGPAFVPMVVSGDAPAAPVVNQACVVEVELGDVRIRIKGPVDRSVLREVFLAARTTR
jgi:transposase-like protein